MRLPAALGAACPVPFEHLDAEMSEQYRSMGLEFASFDEVVETDTISRLYVAFATVLTIPDLATSLVQVLGSVHILRPSDPYVDVSHSDPEIPFSVFISVSPEQSPVDRLRLAEQLVHECMHLQLSLMETRWPLITGSSELHISPWKGCARPTQGILHGFYVFSVIDAFFHLLALHGGLNAAEANHVAARRREIAVELSTTGDALQVSRELTQAGEDLVTQLLGQRHKGDRRTTASQSQPKRWPFRPPE